MRIFAERGLNNVMFQFTEHKFNHKINSFLRYSKTFTQKFHKRGKKIKGAYIDYTWGYKSKGPAQYFTRHAFPVDMNPTQKNILEFAISDMEEKHNIYIDESDPEGKNIYFLRAVQINYVYE